MARDFLPRQWSRMATGVGVVIVRSGMTVGIMVARVLRLVVMVMPAAFDRRVVTVGMIQREHTAEEPGDHAEHQEP